MTTRSVVQRLYYCAFWQLYLFICSKHLTMPTRSSQKNCTAFLESVSASLSMSRDLVNHGSDKWLGKSWFLVWNATISLTSRCNMTNNLRIIMWTQWMKRPDSASYLIQKTAADLPAPVQLALGKARKSGSKDISRAIHHSWIDIIFISFRVSSPLILILSFRLVLLSSI